MWALSTRYRLYAKFEQPFFEHNYSPERHIWLQISTFGYENSKIGLTDALWDIHALYHLVGIIFGIRTLEYP